MVLIRDRRRQVLPLLLAGAVAASATAQETALQREVEFVRKLARDLGFISLAQSETDRLLKEAKAGEQMKMVAQLGIEISLFGAKAMRNDRERQRTLFKDALDRSKEFIDRYRGDPVALQAQIVLADACYEFGRFLADEVEIARSEAPEKVGGLEEQAAGVFQLGRDTCDEVINGLAVTAATDDEANFKRNIAWLRKGILLREHSRAVKKDRDYLAESARGTLEDLIFEGRDAGEETILGMRAMFEMSQINEVLGRLGDAIDAYRDTIETIYEARKELELPPQSVELLGLMMQEAYDHLISSLFELGRSEEVLTTVAEFDARLTELGDSRDGRFGDSVLLTGARAMAESGDPAKVAEGLKIAAKINDDHPADVVGLKAKNIISDILQIQSSLVSSDLLFQVAMGDYQARRFDKGVAGFKRTIAALQPSQGSLAMDAYLHLGRCFGAQQRPLEAIMAFRTGLTKYGNANEKAAGDAARLIDPASRLLRAQAKNDQTFDSLLDDAIRVAANFGTTRSLDRINWDRAATLLAENNYAEAARTLAEIPAESPYYDLALVRRFHALKAAKDLAGARQAADAYRAYRTTPEAQSGANRALAEAEFDYNLGDLAYMQATGEFGEADTTKYPDVVAILSDYRGKYGSVAPGLTQRSFDLLARAHAALGQRDQAEEAYRNLRKFDAQSPLVPKLATVIFSAHFDNVKNLESELAAAIDKRTATAAVESKLKDGRQAALAFGMDYAHTAPVPQYGILFISMQNAQALRDWTKAQELGNKILDRYGSDKEYQERIDMYVKPVLGEILLHQDKYREAYDLLTAAEKQLEADGKTRAAVYPVKRLLCMAMGGWAELNERGEVQPHPGLGMPVEAYEKYYGEYRVFALSDQRGVADYSLPWYRFHWEAYYFARAAGSKDSKYQRYAQTLYSKAKAFDNFEQLKSLGPDGRELHSLFIAHQPR